MNDGGGGGDNDDFRPESRARAKYVVKWAATEVQSGRALASERTCACVWRVCESRVECGVAAAGAR